MPPTDGFSVTGVSPVSLASGIRGHVCEQCGSLGLHPNIGGEPTPKRLFSLGKDGDQGGWFCAVHLERQGSAQPNQIHTQPQAAPWADPWPFNHPLIRGSETRSSSAGGDPSTLLPSQAAASVNEGGPSVSLPYSISLYLSFLECEWTITASTWRGAVGRSLQREHSFHVSRWPRSALEGATSAYSGPAQLPRTRCQLRSERRKVANRPLVGLFPTRGPLALDVTGV